MLALGFWLLFQAFERSNILTGVLGGALIIVGMYLMTGVWRDTFSRFGGAPRIQKKKPASDNTPDEHNGGTSDPADGEKPE